MLSRVVEAFMQFERRQRFLSAMHQDKEVVDEEVGFLKFDYRFVEFWLIWNSFSGIN
jgi:hypothetical protein